MKFFTLTTCPWTLDSSALSGFPNKKFKFQSVSSGMEATGEELKVSHLAGPLFKNTYKLAPISRKSEWKPFSPCSLEYSLNQMCSIDVAIYWCALNLLKNFLTLTADEYRIILISYCIIRWKLMEPSSKY